MRIQTLTDVYDIDHIVVSFKEWGVFFAFAPIHSWSFTFDVKAKRHSSQLWQIEVDLPTCNICLVIGQ